MVIDNDLEGLTILKCNINDKKSKLTGLSSQKHNFLLPEGSNSTGIRDDCSYGDF